MIEVNYHNGEVIIIQRKSVGDVEYGQSVSMSDEEWEKIVLDAFNKIFNKPFINE